MKAVLAKAFAPLEQLVLEEVAPRSPGAGQVVIAVKACGVNFLDGLIVQGKYQTRPPLPFSPGAEVAGVIKEVGAGVASLAPGMRVLAVPGFGGFAQELVTEAAGVMVLPPAMDFITAACFPVVYATSLHALQARAQLRAGETLLVLGAAGGVGLTAIQIGRLLGARVIAAASSEAKLALCREHGADALINYATSELRERVRELTGGKGVDVVYDPVGGAWAEPAVRSLALLGRYLVVGFASGDPKIALNLLLLKQASLVGVFWGAYARGRRRTPGHSRSCLTGMRRGACDRTSRRAFLERYREALDAVMHRRRRVKSRCWSRSAARVAKAAWRARSASRGMAKSPRRRSRIRP
jgi:NADPH2:quinone reductase